jgi:predicted RNase H-like nuclease (RuvC/YqgF family)
MNDVLDDLRAAADYQIRMSGSASDYLLEAENEIKRLRAEVERMREEMPVAESLRVNAKCAEIERDEARAVVWKQAKDNADLRAEVERLTRELNEARAALKASSCAYPDCVDLGPDGKCTKWLLGKCDPTLEAKP